MYDVRIIRVWQWIIWYDEAVDAATVGGQWTKCQSYRKWGSAGRGWYDRKESGRWQHRNILRLPIPILSVCPESAAADIWGWKKWDDISIVSISSAYHDRKWCKRWYAVTDGTGSVGWNTGRAAGQRTFFVYEKTGRYREYASKHCKFNLAERCRHLTCGGWFPVRKQ